MLETIKRNRYTIFYVASIVAIFLLIPSISGQIENIREYNERYKEGITYYGELRNECAVTIAEYLCFILADACLLVIGRKRSIDKSHIVLAIILYYAADSAWHLYHLIVNDNYSYAYSIVFNVIIVIFTIVSLSDKRYLPAALIILLIDAAFALVSTFNGSAVSFSTLILIALLMLGIYLFSSDDNYTNEYYQ